MDHRRTPSPSFPKSSPLQTLVRRASSRRAKNKDALQVPSTPPRHPEDGQQQWSSPVSPLLHAQFRTSVASTAVSAYDGGSTVVESDPFMRHSGHHEQQDAFRAARASQATTGTRQMSMASAYSVDDITASYRDSYAIPPAARGPAAAGPVPAVIVSSEPPPPFAPAAQHHLSGRVPSRLPPGTSNFSRPVTLTQAQAYSSPMGLPAQAPQPYQHGSRPRPPVSGTEEQKRQVLMRHGKNGSNPSADTLQPMPQPPPTAPRPGPQPLLRPSSSATDSVYSSYSYYPYDGQVPSPTTPPGPIPSAPTHTSAQLRPPPPPQAQAPTAPPTSHGQPQPQVARQAQPPRQPSPSDHPSKPPTNAAPTSAPPQTAQDYLQLGITHHLANRLPESAQCFEKSATLDGGCGVGMLMWGLALRHGWGVEKCEEKGFRWLRRAAELAVVDLESGKEMDKSAVKSELVLAIYEVGQSFFRGWGVEKDKKMAVSYFQLAAKLGDPDAQQDLAFCLANGKGCKKDRKEAARWYRAAVAQGVSDVGLAWIYKEKFK